MRFLLPALVLIAGCSAPKPPTPEERAQLVKDVRMRLLKLHVDLALTVDQQRAVRPILDAHRDAMLAALQGAQQSGKNLKTARQLRADVKRIWGGTQSKLEPILTEAQMEEVLRARKEIHAMVRRTLR
jgi:hypothetical protein